MKAGLSVSMLSTSHWFPLTFTCTSKSVRARTSIRTHAHAHACIRAHYSVSGPFGHSLSLQGSDWTANYMRSWLPRLCDACPVWAVCAVCSLYVCPTASRAPMLRACVHRFLLACPPSRSHTSRPRVALSSLLARTSLTSSSLASSLLPLRSQFRHTNSFLFQATAREWPAQTPGGAGAQQHGEWEEDLVQSLVFQRSVQERIMHTLSIPALFAQLQHRLPRLKICRPNAGACVRCATLHACERG